MLKEKRQVRNLARGVRRCPLRRAARDHLSTLPSFIRRHWCEPVTPPATASSSPCPGSGSGPLFCVVGPPRSLADAVPAARQPKASP
jgi:hypothetical protein